MQRNTAKVGLTLLGSLTILLACSSTSHAQQGVIPSVYNFIFGGPNRTVAGYPPAMGPSACAAPQQAFRPNPCNPCAGSNAVGYRAYRPRFSLLPPLFTGYYRGQTAYYGGPARYSNGTTAYYGGTTTYRPQYESPACSVPEESAAQPSEPTPAPQAEEEPRTFREKPMSETEDSYEQDSGGDAGFQPRKSTPDKKDSESDGSGLESEAFKMPTEDAPKPNDTQRRPSPDSNTESGGSGSKSGNGGAPNPDAAGTLQIPAIDLDDKVTWNAAPRHRRQFIRAAFEAPHVVRRSIEHDAEWTPAPAERHVVSK